MDKDNIYTVSELSNEVSNHIKSNYMHTIIIQGEISNCKPTNIHLYFNLKDQNSAVPCVFWRFNNRMDVKDGQKINATAYVDFYGKSSSFQIRVIDIEHIGIGNVHAYYEQIFKKYSQLGYFDSQIKKKLPSEIKSIGIITAQGGAALQDVLYVLKKHNFNGQIFIKGCMVQGKDCPNSIALAINELNKFRYNDNLLDVILITRGGGSYEDLMGFSDPLIIEALYKSTVCTISAVGHEVDTMISDYTADIRAPTPSIAGEILSSHQIQLQEKLQSLEHFIYEKLKYDIMSQIYKHENNLSQLKVKADKGDDLIEKYLDDLNNMFNKFHNNIYKDIYNLEKSFDKINNRLINTDPELLLKSGNIIVTNDSGNVIKCIDEIEHKEKLKIRFMTGVAEVTVKKKWKI